MFETDVLALHVVFGFGFVAVASVPSIFFLVLVVLAQFVLVLLLPVVLSLLSLAVLCLQPLFVVALFLQLLSVGALGLPAPAAWLRFFLVLLFSGVVFLPL